MVGSAKAVFCRKAFSFYWYSGEQPQDICRTFQLTVSVVPDPVASSPPLPRINFPLRRRTEAAAPLRPST